MLKKAAKHRALAIILIVIIFVACSVLFYSYLLNRKSNVVFGDVASMSYQDAMRKIRENSKSSVSAIFDNKPVSAVSTGLSPGKATGLNPRFFNIGDTPASIYRDENGDWYVIGKLRVLDYSNGQWQENCIVENQRFIYKQLQK